jgi:hypothetical protein
MVRHFLSLEPASISGKVSLGFPWRLQNRLWHWEFLSKAASGGHAVSSDPYFHRWKYGQEAEQRMGTFLFVFFFWGGASDFLQTLLSWDLAHHASLGNPIRPSRVGAARRPFDSPNLLLEANNPKGRSRHRPIRDSVVKSSFGHKVVRTQISSDKKGERVGPNTRSRNRFDLSF